ncbi:putative transcriptional regulator [Methylobacterium sp. BE186]|uniref:hypothetical protein n=1 Tax=Methylobacterium sp. BE186 TaxID=2817715 RepID=UPI00286145E8|nr:hypothetical protein [Methylobacterium sp. BE186]MDR7037365.1 putative transcriptional regulator [Methylobacterium sp. BE186]
MTEDLFNWQPPEQPPFVRGSDTSERAADRIAGSVSHLRKVVLDAIERASSGMTCDECEHVTGLRHQTCSARVRELVQLGLIKDSGARRPTRSGRNARVYLRAA